MMECLRAKKVMARMGFNPMTSGLLWVCNAEVTGSNPRNELWHILLDECIIFFFLFLFFQVILDLCEMEDLSKQIFRIQNPDETLKTKWSVTTLPSVLVWKEDGKPTELIA